MENGLLLLSIITCFVYRSKTIECLRCYACTSLVSPECQKLVGPVGYRMIFSDCKKFPGNFTNQCALLIWQENHLRANRPTFYVKRFCSHPTKGYEFCDAYWLLALEMGYNQTECKLCKNNSCNSKAVGYNGSSGAGELSKLSLLCAFTSAIVATALVALLCGDFIE